VHPDEVTALVRARTWADLPWARELVEAFPERLREVLARWELTVVRAYTDGAELPVLEVHGRTSGPAVLKLGGHGSDHAQQVRVLRAADGRGYVRVLAEAEDLDAVLLERLGPTLWTTVADPVEQTLALVDLLPVTWELPHSVGAPFAPSQKARSLLALVDDALARATQDRGEPGAGAGAGAGAEAVAGVEAAGAARDPARQHLPVLQQARSVALELVAAPSTRQVVLHGDPHPGNALRRGVEQVFIDPDGFLGEPEYDAGVVLRDHGPVIDELERTEGSGAGRHWHAALVARTAQGLDLDAERIAAWAFLERVTTGIYLGLLGAEEESEAWLRTAARVMG